MVFTPNAGFAGQAITPYVVRDRQQKLSNQATLSVNVKPDPTAAVTLFSFEAGAAGWAPGNWLPDSGSVEQSTEFATDGTHGLKVNSTAGHWFGTTFAAPVDLTGKSTLTLDLRTGTAARA